MLKFSSVRIGPHNIPSENFQMFSFQQPTGCKARFVLRVVGSDSSVLVVGALDAAYVVIRNIGGTTNTNVYVDIGFLTT